MYSEAINTEYATIRYTHETYRTDLGSITFKSNASNYDYIGIFPLQLSLPSFRKVVKIKLQLLCSNNKLHYTLH